MSNYPYVLDANIFIEAHRRYYAFSICPGFWSSLEYGFRCGWICSIDRVLHELSGAQDILAQWVTSDIPAGFFQTTASEPVIRNYTLVNQWVVTQAFKKPAVDHFFSGADPWLIAFAMSTGATLVTHEQREPGALRRVPIPSVCDRFHVPFINTFDLLRNLGTRFHWDPPAK